ncbi:hypothetical protein RB195_013897 [Necator americanus]|uniref:Uncharacterized protein n=1 Tax=Necator americanus TaxID=51031 RepID=A0ABR1DXN2_NECAM
MSGATPDLAIYDPVSNFTHGFLHQIRGMLPPKKNMWEETPQSRGTEIVLRLILSSLSCYSDVGDGQQQGTLDVILERMERMFSDVQQATATPAATTEFVTNSLSARLPELHFDSDS